MKIKVLSSILFCILWFTSCEDFLTTGLKGDYTSENYYTTPESATMAVTGIYHSLYETTRWIWVFGDVASDDAVKGGNAGDQADINFIDDFSAKTDNGIIQTYWTAAYETIARANNAIYYIGKMDFDHTLKSRLTAEAKYLRAYSYFHLVNIFGKTPLKTLPHFTEKEIHIGLSETDTIYAQIEKDLTEASRDLPQDYPTEKGRVTKGAAYGLLAKVQLYRGKYAECLSTVELLEQLDRYDLVTNYEDLFKAGAEDSIEVIFAVRYIQDSEASLGNPLNVWFAPSTEGGYYFNAPTQSYVDAFTEKTVTNEDDPRLDASIGRNGKEWFNDNTFSSTWSEATGYLVKKYNERLIAGVAKSYCVIPYHAIRYADILLMKAEAMNEWGESNLVDAVSLAAAEVNRVRSRANLSATTATTQDALRNVIRNERRKELGFEFHRFFDLMRWGRTVAEDALGANFTWTEPRFYYPLPQSELDANKGLMK
jgi:hypothetical protein